ncbi:tyrosine-protein phosphatase [Brevibacterium litoralis]|uniref:tyrosine-protein phosphatase n=1 Tax=Brevibacterium litoralis TaxID=3138935 RepID=UPI0032F02CDD
MTTTKKTAPAAEVPAGFVAGGATHDATGEGVTRLPGLANLRDVSTHVSGIVSGMLLRSDAPFADDDHAGYPTAWPPRTVIDLRTGGEQVGVGAEHALAAHAEVVHLPVMGEKSTDPGAFPATLGETYVDMLHSAGPMLVEGLRAIATGPAPVLVHCAAGKDRTGTLVALALVLAGADRAEVVVDYEATDPNMDGVHARMGTSAHVVMQQFEAAGIDMSGLMGAKAPDMEAVLDAVEAFDGGAEGWFTAHGGTAEDLQALRARLCEGGAVE